MSASCFANRIDPHETLQNEPPKNRRAMTKKSSKSSVPNQVSDVQQMKKLIVLLLLAKPLYQQLHLLKLEHMVNRRNLEKWLKNDLAMTI